MSYDEACKGYSDGRISFEELLQILNDMRGDKESIVTGHSNRYNCQREESPSNILPHGIVAQGSQETGDRSGSFAIQDNRQVFERASSGEKKVAIPSKFIFPKLCHNYDITPYVVLVYILSTIKHSYL